MKGERIVELEKLLNRNCRKYDKDCSKCPYQKECEEYQHSDLAGYNSICYSCKKWLHECNGTKCQTWTGCIYREV